ncbi:MAG TPA: glutaredoxin family protein [Pseudogracilibacillus sp.]|nr:glutaredoxin family protein [Pseudogracilibacillus sp.]
MHVIFYTKQNCPLCEEAYLLLELFEEAYALDIEVRDIYTNDAWLEAYQISIPVIQIKDTILTANDMDVQRIEGALQRHT